MKRVLASCLLILVTSFSAAQERPPDADAEAAVRVASAHYYEGLDRGDAEALDTLLAEDYLAVLPGSQLLTKAEQLALLRKVKGSALVTTVERTWQEVKVRRHGDTAVLTGFTVAKEKDRAGVVGTTRSFVTHLWVKQDGRWRLAHAQRAATGKAAEAERWSEVFRRGTGFNPKPNAFLVEAVKQRKPGEALDVGMGQGRNALHLAKQGWEVTGVDISAVAIAQAQEEARRQGLKLATAYQSADEFDFGTGRWDLVCFLYFGPRRYVDKVRQGLKPGGLVFVEGFHRDATKERKIGGGGVFDTGELRKLFTGFRILRYEEVEGLGDYSLEKVRLVRLLAQKE